MKRLLVLVLILSFNAFGHGDHSTPGVLPSAPHGGVLAKALHQPPTHTHKKKHSQTHEHGDEEDKIIFFEGVIKNNTLMVYVLDFDKVSKKSFKTMDISLFEKVTIKVTDARKKEILSNTHENFKNHWGLNLKDKKSHRMIVEIEAFKEGSSYTAKVQIENLR